MKAIVFTVYGSADVLQLKDIDKPVPQDNQVLVKVYAAAANPLDWHFMRGAPFVARLDNGLRKPKRTSLGADIAGRVEAVGSVVTQFKVGDEVYGTCGAGFAEYACAAENKLALKPANLAFEDAAAVPVAAMTALQGLRDTGHIHSGQKVLVNGAAGGVGSFAVQIAKSYGTEVTGVTSTRNLDMARQIGADHVIDYTQEDFTRSGQSYDLIYDAVGNHSVADYKRALTPTGTCVIAGFTSLSRLFGHMILGPLMSRKGGQRVAMMGTKPNQDELIVLNALLEARKIIPVIDRCYPLSETAEAIRYLEKGHARGKVVVIVEPNSHK